MQLQRVSEGSNECRRAVCDSCRHFGAWRSYSTDSRAPDEIDRDWVLIATAREADHRIISLNDRERQRFREIALQAPELHTIFWTDPQREDVPAWLREGAPEREALRL